MTSTSKIFSRKLKFEKNVKTLSDNQMFEVYSIIKDNGYPYTKNEEKKIEELKTSL